MTLEDLFEKFGSIQASIFRDPKTNTYTAHCPAPMIGWHEGYKTPGAALVALYNALNQKGYFKPLEPKKRKTPVRKRRF